MTPANLQKYFFVILYKHIPDKKVNSIWIITINFKDKSKYTNGIKNNIYPNLDF